AMKKMSRREMARILAGVPALRIMPMGGQPPAASGYIGPLTGVTTGIDDRRFDPVVFSRDLYAAAPRRLRFSAHTREQAEQWQAQLRTRLTELMGGFPRERHALRPVTLETRTFPGYRREKVVFDSRPGVSVLAYVLVPANAKTPAATMICV